MELRAFIIVLVYLFTLVGVISCRESKKHKQHRLKEKHKSWLTEDKSTRQTTRPITRQAIPVAVIQGGALGNFATKDKTIQGNVTIPVCNATYQNCANVLIEQAKIDRILREQSTNVNITEPAYNASVAGALDNNKSTVTHNKTIHLLQNVTNAFKQPTERILSIEQLTNKTIPINKTISIAPNNISTKDLEQASAFEIYPLRSTNNKTIVLQKTKLFSNVPHIPLNKTNHQTLPKETSSNINLSRFTNVKNLLSAGNCTTNASYSSSHPVINETLSNVQNATKDELLKNTKTIEPFKGNLLYPNDSASTNYTTANPAATNLTKNTALNSTNHTTVTNLTKRVQLSLPSHATNIYLHWLVDRMPSTREEDKDRDEEDYNHGILVGPLDDLPDNPNGNGPQDKNTKDLEGPNRANARKDSKHKKKRRPKSNLKKEARQRRNTYNFEMNSGSQPYDFMMNSEDLQKNVDYTGLSEKDLHAADEVDKLVYKTGGESRTPIVERSDVWQPPQTEHNFDFREQLYNGAPIRNYDNFIESQAADLDRGGTPRIGTSYEIQSVENRPHQPIGEEVFQGSENIYDNPVQKLLEENEVTRSGPSEPLEPYIRGRDTPEPFPSQLLRERGSDLDGSIPYSTEFNPDNFATGGAIPSSAFHPDNLEERESTHSIDEFNPDNLAGRGEISSSSFNPDHSEARANIPFIDRFNSDNLSGRKEIQSPVLHPRLDVRDQQIESLLNNYDEQTKMIAKLYHELHAQRLRNDDMQMGDLAPVPDQLTDPEQENNIPRSEGPEQNPFIHSSGNIPGYFRAQDERDGYVVSPDTRDQYQRRDVLERRDDYNPSFKPIYQNAVSPRNEVPNNDFLHSNVIQEFLKQFAQQNRLPREENFQRDFMFNEHSQNPNDAPNNPIMNLLPDGLRPENTNIPASGSTPFLPLPNTNVWPLTSTANFAVPAVASLSPMTSAVPQNIPSPQQAAMMTNMGMPSSLSFNPMSAEQVRDTIANQQGMAMLMVASPPENQSGNDEEKKEMVEHKELTHDGIKRTSSNVTGDNRDFSVNLKQAADFVLNNAVKDGNISILQREEIEKKLGRILDKQYKNKTRGEIRAQTRAQIPRSMEGPCEDARQDCTQFKAGGVCPFMRTFMRGTCRKTCQECAEYQTNGLTAAKIYDYILRKSAKVETPTAKIMKDVMRSAKSTTPKVRKKVNFQIPKTPKDPIMYLSFESVGKDGMITDNSGNKNNAFLKKGSTLSPRILGSCGKAVELNDGSISWSGDHFKRKPDTAISIAMWVKVRKSGVINWFANGKKGDKMFYAKTNGTAVPAKVWTHIVGTFDSNTGLARIYINGALEQEQQQNRGAKLAKNWLVNGIGSNFGDDSLHYVDEVVIYDRALTNPEIKTLFNRCMFNRMVLHYGFQKGNKTNINDQSGLENNAILIGGAIQKENCDRCGFCLDLTKGPEPNMKIQQIAQKNLPKTKLSIAVWLNLNSTKGVHNIFTTESSDGNIGYRLQVVNGRVRWAIGTDTVPVLFDNMTRNEVVPEALWTHIIVTYSNENGVVKMYTNSVLKFRDVVPEWRREYLPSNWDNDASIGDRTFRGYLDEFIMYNWELDDSEALYVRNYCADHPKLVRFTVRVPLTKKTIVPKAQAKPKIEKNWWDVYMKLVNDKLSRSKKAVTKMKELEINPSDAFALLKRRK